MTETLWTCAKLIRIFSSHQQLWLAPHDASLNVFIFKSPQKMVPKWLHHTMFVLVSSLCLAFSGADIELDFILMTSAIQ